MPDKDYIHKNVKRHYYSLIDALRADLPHSDKVVDYMSKGIVKNLEEYGNKPIALISKITKLLIPHFAKTPLERQDYDTAPIYDELEKIAADSRADKRAKAFIIDGAYRLINKLPTASSLNSTKISHELFREYIFEMFDADCDLPKSIESDPSYSHKQVKKNLENELKALDKIISYHSKQLNKHKKIKNLRKKPVKRKEIDLNEDIGKR